jgi:hypothetical protein
MRSATRFASLGLAAALAVSAAPARAQTSLPVFSGDPIDGATGQARSILPGLPLMLPGDDDVYGTADDVIDTNVTGDVDVVVRAGGIFTAGAIPPPAAGVAAARRVVPGRAGTGLPVAFQLVLSDGAPLPPAGNPLTGPEHNGRGALVVAYPDLDGDGVLGPTNADGGADNEIELQETLTVAGRQVGVVENGVAGGSLGVSLGAPASAGGLGLVLVGGALMGQTAAKYFFDGPWVATLLPFMPPIDPTRIIGRGNVRPPDPENLVEVDLAGERFGYPPPDHPVLGTAFAIPLDGSSPTVDLARSEAGSAVAGKLGRPVDPATFAAGPLRRLLPAVDQQGRRLLVGPVEALSMMDDGPGQTVSLVLFAADVLGNPTDPGAAMAATLEAGPALLIVSPDTDGDLHRETIPLATAAAAALVLDDAGSAGDGGAGDRLVVLVDGLPSDSIRTTFVPGQGGQAFTLQVNMAGTGSGAVVTTQGGIACGAGCTQWAAGAQVTLTAVADAGSEFVGWSGCGVSANPAVVAMTTDRTCTATFDLLSSEAPEALRVRRAVLARGRSAGKGWVVVDALFTADPATFDPTAVPVTLTVRDGPGLVFYSRTLAAGAFESNGPRAVFRDPRGTLARVARFAFARPRPRRVPDEYRVRVNVRRLDLAVLDPATVGFIVVELTVGDARYAATVGCAPYPGRPTLRCRP